MLGGTSGATLARRSAHLGLRAAPLGVCVCVAGRRGKVGMVGKVGRVGKVGKVGEATRVGTVATVGKASG